MPKVEQTFILFPDGLHVWGNASRLSGVPEDIIQQSAGYTFHSMQNPEWRRLSTDTMIVMGDLPDEALKTLAVTAEKLEEMLEKEIAGPKRQYIYKIRAFKDRNQFCAYARRCGNANALSLYDPNKGEIGVHFSQATAPEEFEETYAHEFVHAYMHRVYGVTEPLWFAEGMAEYFSRLEWTAKGFKPTGYNWQAAMFGEEVAQLPFQTVLNATREELYGINFPAYYSACWVIVNFLLKKHPEVINALLHKQHVDLGHLEKEYRQFLKRKLGV